MRVDTFTQSAVGREHPVIPGEMGTRSGHEGRQACEPVLRGEDHVGGAILVGVREFEHDASCRIDGQALECDGRARHVASEALELAALPGAARHGCVQGEALQVRGQGAGRTSEGERSVSVRCPAPGPSAMR